MPRSLASQRLEGIAVWRASLMLGGLLVHATMGDESLPGLNAITVASAMFRMGCFFLIAGLLTAAALIRHGDGRRWLRRRLIRLGVPTLFGIAVLCPLTGMVRSEPGAPAFLLYHLWFMVALIGYMLIGYAAHRLGGIGWAALDRLDTRVRDKAPTQAVLMIATAAASFNLMVAALIVVERCVPPPLVALTAQFWLAAGYAPMFLLGFVLARTPALRRGFCSRMTLPLAILGTVAIVNILWRLPRPAGLTLPVALDQFVHIASVAAAPPAAAALMLRSAFAVRRAPRLLLHLGEASFTMYLVHYPLMAAIKSALAPRGWGPWSMFAAALVGGGGLSYLIWAGPVRHSVILSLLLAGRADGRRGTRDRASGELLLPGAPRTAGIPFCCPVGSNRAILE